MLIWKSFGRWILYGKIHLLAKGVDKLEFSEVMTMNKIITLVLCLVLALSLVGCGAPKHSGFVADGENFSAQVNDGELVLDLRKDAVSDIWVCEDESDLFAIDYTTEHDDLVEFHITTLNAGSDTIVINHMLDDGSSEAYNLTLKISRQQRTRLLINSISFVKVD